MARFAMRGTLAFPYPVFWLAIFASQEVFTTYEATSAATYMIFVPLGGFLGISLTCVDPEEA